MNNTKNPIKLKQDRYEKFNKSNQLMKESSFMTSSIQTTATLNHQRPHSHQIKQCRICLHQQDQQGQKQVFSPCKCTGSVKYLHKLCFVSWVNKMLQQKTPHQKTKMILQGNQCEICKVKIPIKGNIEYYCSPSQRIKLKIKSKPILFTVFTLIEILCLVVLSFVLSMMVEMGIGFDQGKIVNSIIMLCSLAILVCLGFGIGYFYIIDYFIIERFMISDFGQMNTISINNNISDPNPQIVQSNIIKVNNSIINLQQIQE